MYNRQAVPRLTNSWIFIDFANRIKKGSRRFIQVMHRDLVLWRTQSGKISLLDAYCPHLGGNLSHGKVCGEALECNYHKKRFNSDGTCHGLSLKASSYLLQELNNMVFAWFGDKPPTWQVPDFLTGYRSSRDCKWKIFRTLRCHYNFSPKNAGENAADANHFKTFHNLCTTYEPSEIIEMTDHNLICRIKTLGSPWSKKISQEVVLDVNTIGASTIIVDSYIKLQGREFCLKFIYLGTPTIGENTNFTINTARRVEPKKQGASLLDKAIDYIFANVSFIASIYEFRRESKEVFEPRSNYWNPQISEQETTIRKYYDWYNRFYIREKMPEEI